MTDPDELDTIRLPPMPAGEPYEARVTHDRLSLAYPGADVEAVRQRHHADVLAALAAHGRVPAGPPELVGRGDACVVEVPLAAPPTIVINVSGALLSSESVEDVIVRSLDAAARRGVMPRALRRAADAEPDAPSAPPAPDGPGDDAA